MEVDKIDRDHDLDASQELSLKEFWCSVLKFWGYTVDDEYLLKLLEVDKQEDIDAKKSSFFGGWGSSNGDANNEEGEQQKSDPFTKYNLDKDASEKLFWNLLNKESPDSFILNFIRARKWNIQKSLSMFVRSINWRLNDMYCLAIIKGGEAEAVRSNKIGLIKNLEIQKAVICGYDIKNRPIILVRPKLHFTNDQTEAELEEFAILIIEQARLFMKDPIRATSILFDLSDFTLSNMDYSPVKFLVSIFEAHYPECLGPLLIHQAPWIFSPIWNIVKTWLDPVVVSKVQFTYNAKDLSKSINMDQIPDYLGGECKLDFDNITLPDGSADTLLADQKTRDEILQERQGLIQRFIELTVKWIETDDAAVSKEIFQMRIELFKELSENYSKLDPYTRSRSVYDINGTLKI